MPAAEHVEVAVVGGGIAGLSAAYRLRAAGREVALFEARERVGGVISTVERDGLFLETAAGGFLSRGEDGVSALANELGVELVDAQAAKKRWVYADGTLCQVPSSPSSLWKTKLLSRRAIARLFAEPLAGKASGEESVYDFAARRLGPEVAENLVAPFVTGVFAGDARKLTIEAFPDIADLDGRGGVLAAALKKMASGRRSAPIRLQSPATGSRELIDALASSLGEIVSLSTPVTNLRVSGDRVAFEAGGRTVTADVVVLAAPAYVAAELLAALSQESADVLAAIPHVPVAVCHLAYSRSQVRHSLDGFGFIVREGEPLDILGCVFDSSIWPDRFSGERVLFRCLLGGERIANIVSWSDEQILAAAHESLDRALGVNGEPSATNIVRWPTAIPQYRLGHMRRVRGVEDALEKHHVVLAGSAYRGVSVNECVSGARVVVNRVASILGAALVLATLACSGSSGNGAPRSISDGGARAPQSEAAAPAPAKTGRVEVAVRWRGAPAEYLRYRGADGCGGLQPPALSVHHTGGVRGAVVALPGATGGPDRPAEIAIADCHVTPRIGLARGDPAALYVGVEDERPYEGAIVSSTVKRPFSLRVIGARARVVLDGTGLYRVDLPDYHGSGYVYSYAVGQAKITGDSGKVSFSNVPVGAHEVVVTHAPVAVGQEPIVTKTTVQVNDGEQTAIVVDIAQ